MAQPEPAFNIQGLPTIQWLTEPEACRHDSNAFTIRAGAKTDLFLDPQKKYLCANSPKALFLPAERYLLSCKVKVDFREMYDAGGLLVYADEKTWAKLCFEYSDKRQATIVSVVNKLLSDDCNHMVISQDHVYLRVYGTSNHVYAFYYSSDNKTWNLVRYFQLPTMKNTQTGFTSQSPAGQLCDSFFSEIEYYPGKVIDLRSGE